MLNSTLVKINKTPKKVPAVKDSPLSEMSRTQQLNTPFSENTGWEFTPIKKLKYNDISSAYFKFKNFLLKQSNSDKEALGLMIHNSPNLRVHENLMLLLMDNNELIKKTIKNPLYNNIKGSQRALSAFTMDVTFSIAMQSQLFAMLNANTADKRWMSKYLLDDFQQDPVYAWQEEEFPSGNKMSASQMASLMKNVLNVTKAPSIKLNFEDDIPYCSFSVSAPSSLLPKKIKGESVESLFSWLEEVDSNLYQKIGHLEKNKEVIGIDSMTLSIASSWGMSAPVLLHELAHYLMFISPTPYRLNKGDILIGYDEYEKLFSGHGAVFLSIFSYLLIKFAYVRKESLYLSLEANNLEWFELNSLTTDDINNGIRSYIENLNES